MKRISKSIFILIVAPLVIGIGVGYLTHLLITHQNDNSITVSPIENIVPFRIAIGHFWFDEEKKAYGSFVSSLRTDGVELTEINKVPDRNIARGLQYRDHGKVNHFRSVPLPNQQSCLLPPQKRVEIRESKVWRELIASLEVEVLILGEMTSEPRELRLWIGSARGPLSLVLPFSTKLEITQSTERAKVAILMALIQVAEDRLHLEENDDLHVPKVRKALDSINHALGWRGVDKDSHLAIRVTRARLQENLLIHFHDIPTRDIEESYWVLKQSNELSKACSSISVMYEFSEANFAWILTRRTKSAVWNQRAVATLERISERATAAGQPEFVAISKMTRNRLEIERGIRQEDFSLISAGFEKLEGQYLQLPDINSPMLWIKLPDTMITLYRQASKVTGNEAYLRRAEEIGKCFPNLPHGAYETNVKGPTSVVPESCLVPK